MKEKTCCCTGHRPHGFLWEYEKISKEQTLYLSLLTKSIERLIQDNGITRFFSGMAHALKKGKPIEYIMLEEVLV